DPRWLIYLPPTMAPTASAPEGEPLLERPDEAFAYFREQNVARVICEEKHMGSRAVLVVARNAAAARKRFGIGDGKQGVVYSRTGRPFFRDDVLEAELVRRTAMAIEAAGMWQALETEWICLDAELMPWS